MPDSLQMKAMLFIYISVDRNTQKAARHS